MWGFKMNREDIKQLLGINVFDCIMEAIEREMSEKISRFYDERGSGEPSQIIIKEPVKLSDNSKKID